MALKSLSSAKISGLFIWIDCWFDFAMTENNFTPGFIAASDKQLLDVYSATITGVVRHAAQAVAHIKVFKKTKCILTN